MKPVAVMTFHSVGDNFLPYNLSRLTTSVKVLDLILRWLKRHEFKTLTHQELFDHLSTGKAVPEKSLLLTFDDGYLDNWVFVYPLLKKYGLRGTIYVTGDFVDPSTELRANLQDSWDGKVERADLPGLGYCNWAELRAMSEDGTLEIQSHLMSHSWQATSNKIVGFHSPKKPWYWEAWNREPSAKPHWLSWSREDLDQRIPWGAPVFEAARSHTGPRCTPDPEMEKHLAAKVLENAKGNGPETGRPFFNQDDCMEKLTQWAAEFPAALPSMESQTDFEKRFRWECSESRRLIEKNVPNQKANFMAWPGGDYDERLQAIALETFDATFTTDSGVTLPGEDPTLIKRCFFAQRGPELLGWDSPSYLHFVGRLQRLRGNRRYFLQTSLTHRLLRFTAWLKDR